ncbi:MAG: hypothetical protein ACPGU1_20255 [Myxococcota bacterium]
MTPYETRARRTGARLLTADVLEAEVSLTLVASACSGAEVRPDIEGPAVTPTTLRDLSDGAPVRQLSDVDYADSVCTGGWA